MDLWALLRLKREDLLVVHCWRRRVVVVFGYERRGCAECRWGWLWKKEMRSGKKLGERGAVVSGGFLQDSNWLSLGDGGRSGVSHS